MEDINNEEKMKRVISAFRELECAKAQVLSAEKYSVEEGLFDPKGAKERVGAAQKRFIRALDEVINSQKETGLRAVKD